MTFNALAELRSGGIDVDRLPEAGQQALATLSPAEVETLNAVATQIAAAGPDVSAHLADDTGWAIY